MTSPFDAIVSNPPYVADGELLEPQVRDYEPHGALFAGLTGLEVYERLIVWPTRFLGYTAEFLDRSLVDGLVQGVSWLPRLVGRYLLGPIQNGLIQYYAAVTALSVGARALGPQAR